MLAFELKIQYLKKMLSEKGMVKRLLKSTFSIVDKQVDETREVINKVHSKNEYNPKEIKGLIDKLGDGIEKIEDTLEKYSKKLVK